MISTLLVTSQISNKIDYSTSADRTVSQPRQLLLYRSWSKAVHVPMPGRPPLSPPGGHAEDIHRASRSVWDSARRQHKCDLLRSGLSVSGYLLAKVRHSDISYQLWNWLEYECIIKCLKNFEWMLSSEGTMRQWVAHRLREKSRAQRFNYRN